MAHSPLRSGDCAWKRKTICNLPSMAKRLLNYPKPKLKWPHKKRQFEMRPLTFSSLVFPHNKQL